MSIDSGAWNPVEESQDDNLWTRFCEHFSFRPGMKPDSWPSIREPVPAITWDISSPLSLYDLNYTAFQTVEYNYRRLIGAGFRSSVKPGQVVFGMSWHHQTYVADPRQKDLTDKVDQWQVWVLPLGNYEILLSEDFTLGVFCHPWEQSLCVFGRPLLEFIDRTAGDLGPVLRRSTEAGVTVERIPTPIPSPTLCPACSGTLLPWGVEMQQQTCPLCGEQITR